MIEVIYKYELSVGDQIVAILEGAEILTAQMQGQYLCLWAKVRRGAHPVPTRILVCGTGCDLPAGNWSYVATVQAPPFVWHVFKQETAKESV